MTHVTEGSVALSVPVNWLTARWPPGHWLGVGGGAHWRLDGSRHNAAPMLATCDALAHWSREMVGGGANAYALAPTDMV
jgi:hypothetical protein